MPRATTNKFYRTFVKGLITEAGYLTYPDDSSSDELNTVLSRKGNRTRRLGINYSDTEIDTEALVNPSDELARNEYVWKAADNKPHQNFLVLQTGANLTFYDLGVDPPIDGKKTFSINLESYLRIGAIVGDVEKSFVFFSAGRGFLFIVNEFIEPLVVKYNSALDTITTTPIVILVRDFEGLNDNLQNDEEPNVLSKEHHYNLQNQGWVTNNTSSSSGSAVTINDYTYSPYVGAYSPYGYVNNYAYQNSMSESPIFKFQSALGRYPGNNKQWWLARAEADDPDKGIKQGDFLPNVLNNLYSGNNKAPKGHYILNAFRKDRGTLSGISGLSIEELETRPSCVAFFSGRAWFAAQATVYYSQILDTTSLNKAGMCYQEADPTSEDISDLLPSDGGVVPIPEADKIVQILPLSSGILVFAQNGVWFVSGGDSAFSATNISVSKVSPIGTSSPLSIVETDGTIFWWSEVGIQAIQQASGAFGPIPGKFGNTNVSEQTIQTFYNNIGETAKAYVKACYDTRNNVMCWLYQGEEITSSNFEYNRALFFDLTLSAFYPWKFSSIVGGPKIRGVFLEIGLLNTSVEEIVTDDGITVTNSGATITDEEFSVNIKPSNIHYVTDVTNEGLAFSKTNNNNFCDWQSFNGTGVGYDSYIETGYELNEDAMRRKQVVYLFAHLRRTESITWEDPSSCKFTAKWDWSNNRTSNKWASEVEVYRPTKVQHTSFDVITSKNKVRGSGKSIQFRFGTNEIGKNFDLLGWSVAFAGNTQP